jgi:hypothetical protein
VGKVGDPYYRVMNQTTLPLTGGDTEPRKKCTSCQKTKPIAEFVPYSKSYHSHGRRHSECRQCFRLRKEQWRKTPSGKQMARRAALKVRQRRIFLARLKLILGCAVCGYKRSPRAIDFHHIDPTQKRGVLSKLRYIAPIRNELLRCVCLCKNCHAEHHDQSDSGTSLRALTIEQLRDAFARIDFAEIRHGELAEKFGRKVLGL